MRLHSAYNPQREALKYIDSLNIPANVAYFVLIECGEGYLIPILRDKFPQAALISLHIRDEFCVLSRLSSEKHAVSPDAEWSPSSALGCQEFLEQHIEDIEAAHVKLIEWRPALALDPKAYLCLLSEAAEFIKRCDANKRTTTAFSVRWQKNSLKNARLFAVNAARTWHERQEINKQDIVLCAAGPSLETQLETIQKLRSQKQYTVLAVSSAVGALKAAGIFPDAVFTSDGSNWARLHLFEILRHRERKPLVAAPLNAALLADFSDYPVILFGDGSEYQFEILRRFALPLLALPQRGTVTAAALDFALGWTQGRVFLAGADFSCDGPRSHARPYAFDALFEQTQSRLAPLHHLCWERARALTEGQSYAIYANWFKKQARLYPARVFSIANNHRALGFQPADI